MTIINVIPGGGGDYTTIAQGVGHAQPGDTVYIHAGTYNEYVYISGGTAGNWLTIAGYPEDTAIVDGTGITPPLYGGLFMLYRKNDRPSNYIHIKDLTFQNLSTSGRRGIRSTFTCSGTAFTPSQYIYIDNCNFYNFVSCAISIWEDYANIVGWIQNVRVSGCTFNNIQYGMDAGECVTFVGVSGLMCRNNNLTAIFKIGMVAGANSNNVTFAKNYVCNKSGNYNNWEANDDVVGIYLDASSKAYGGWISGAVISGNYVTGVGRCCTLCAEVGAPNSTINNVVVENNVFLSSGSDASYSNPSFAFDRGILAEGGTNWYAKNITIKHNTMYITGSTWYEGGVCFWLGIPNSYIQNITLANNLMINASQTTNGRYVIDSYVSSTTSQLHLSSNLYWSKAIKSAKTKYSDEVDHWESNAVIADPLVVNDKSPNYDFHLTASSPAKDAGMTYYGVPFDYDGNPRPQGAGYDIGAYEYCVSAIPVYFKFAGSTYAKITGTGYMKVN